MKINHIKIGLTGLILGILANSIDIKKSEEFRFNNPVSVNTTPEQAVEIVRKRPEMKDLEYSLDILGLRLPIITYRTVFNPLTNESYSGRLDSKDNIHSSEGLYELQSAHDSNWYVKKN